MRKRLLRAAMLSPCASPSSPAARSCWPSRPRRPRRGELRTALREDVDKPPALKGKVLYGGRLDVDKAIQAITR